MQRLRRALRYARACAFVASGASARARRRLDGTRAAVLMYHRVLPADEAARSSVEPGMYVTPETFARHLDWLASAFSILPLHEIVSRLVERRPLPAGACAITFDDGWRDNHDFALPELSRRRLPATVFVVTERIGTDGDFWPDEMCRRFSGLARSAQRELLAELEVTRRGEPIDALIAHLKELGEDVRERVLDRVRARTRDPAANQRSLLGWDELDRLARASIDIEAHGATHAILTRIAPADAERELRSARARLLERGHGRHALLAYPSGANDAETRRLARAAGYAAAVTTEPGYADAAIDPFAIPRLGVHDDVARTRAEFLETIRG